MPASYPLRWSYDPGEGQKHRESPKPVVPHRYRQIPIIWMSGHAREAELQKGELSRDEPFLHKPVSPDLLLQTVAQAIERNIKVRS